jgi:thiamine pyrophosphokinase
VIAGDFDSLEDSVEKFYRKKLGDFEVEFRHDDDQNSTDFDKSIDIVKKFEISRKVSPRSYYLNVDGFYTSNSRIRRFGRTS